MTIAPTWQHPYVNVFKLCDVDSMRDVATEGEVTDHMDRIIGKKVFKVRGTISANNWLRVPKLKSSTLGLTGRFVYIQIKVTPVKAFVIHIEAVTADLNIHRISISNLYTDAPKRKSQGILLPYMEASHRWSVVAVDVATALRGFSVSPFQTIRSIQFCSWLTVRSVYTSDLRFSLQALPRDMALSHALDSSSFEMRWLPGEPADVEQTDDIMSLRRLPKELTTARPFTAPRTASSAATASPDGGVQRVAAPLMSHQRAPLPRSPTPSGLLVSPRQVSGGTQSSTLYPMSLPRDVHLAPPLMESITATVPFEAARAAMGDSIATEAATVNRSATFSYQVASASGTSGSTAFSRNGGDGMSPQPHMAPHASVRSPATGARRLTARDTDEGSLLQPDPVLQLERVSAFSGELPRGLQWPPLSSEVVFAAASLVVAMQVSDTTDAQSGAQRFFLGHTAHVVAIAFDAEGALMATAQEGKTATVRLWDFRAAHCLAILNAHAFGLSCLDISLDGRCLAAVGHDTHGKQLIVLWDIADVKQGRPVEMLVRQTTEFNIRSLRFSAFDEDQLITCGRDSIRLYRLKAGQLRGISVRLGAPDKRVSAGGSGGGATTIASAMGPNIFTDIAFESPLGAPQRDMRSVLVASASGAVFHVDILKRTVEAVYQLHSSAINSLAVYDGFCVTGSDDRLLRVWPMDFSDYLLEAEHEALVTSIGIAPDGLRVCVGTENGTIGVLDIPTHQYVTLLRSHGAIVTSVAADPVRDEYCTVSADGTIRIWDAGSHQQLYEFDAPGEQVTCVAYHPRLYELACGFNNGRVRVFDIAATTIVQEHRQHRGELVSLQYSADGSRLLSAGADGGLCVYDVVQVYLPIKFLSAGPTARNLRVALAVSADGRYMASVSHDPYRHLTSLLLFHCSTLEPYMRIETNAQAYTCLAFSADSTELWALSSSDNRLDRFELAHGALLQSIAQLHRMPASVLAVDPGGSFVVTAGQDLLLKVWANDARDVALLGGTPASQAFVGHPGVITAAAFQGRQLITVGDSSAIFSWRIHGQAAGAPGLGAGGTTTVRDWASRQLGVPVIVESRAAAGSSVWTDNADSVLGDLGALSLRRPDPRGVDPPVQDAGIEGGVAPVAPRDWPLEAAVVVGYTPSGAENMVWRPSSGLFAYAVDNVVVVEDLESRRQVYLHYHDQRISCLTATPDGRLLASAPVAVEEALGTAAVVVWDMQQANRRAVLQYHPTAVQAMAFSPDGHWLVTVGRDPERSVALWDLRKAQELMAVGRTAERCTAVTWLHNEPLPEFVTAGVDGVLLWTLQADSLEQRQLPLGASQGIGCTAVAADEASNVVAADDTGGIWEVQLGGGQASIRQVAELAGEHVTQVRLGAGKAAIATAGGMVKLYSRPAQGPWVSQRESHPSGGAIGVLHLDPADMSEAVAASASGTIWFLDLTTDAQVALVCGHLAPVVSVVVSPHDSSVVLTSCASGVLHAWTTTGQQLEPLWAFRTSPECSCATLVPSSFGNGGGALAGFADGALRHFALPAPHAGLPATASDAPVARPMWSADARHEAPLVAIVCHPVRPLVLSASSDGCLAVSDVASGRLRVFVDEHRGDVGLQGLCAVAVSGGDGAMCALAWRERLLVKGTPWEDSTTWLASTYLVEAEQPHEIPRSSDFPPASVQFVPGSAKCLVYTTPVLAGRVLVYDYRASAVVRALSLPQMLCCLDISPDGLTLALGGRRGSIFLANVDGASEGEAGEGSWVELRGHNASLGAVRFANGGGTVVSSAGGSVMVWRPEARLRRLQPEPNPRAKLLY